MILFSEEGEGWCSISSLLYVFLLKDFFWKIIWSRSLLTFNIVMDTIFLFKKNRKEKSYHSKMNTLSEKSNIKLILQIYFFNFHSFSFSNFLKNTFLYLWWFFILNAVLLKLVCRCFMISIKSWLRILQICEVFGKVRIN